MNNYQAWKKEKFEKLISILETKLQQYKKPTVIVLEIAHFTLPEDKKNIDWAFKNMKFANKLCKYIIQKYKSKYKIIPTLLINNFDCQNLEHSDEIIKQMVKNQKYITQKSLKIISERNLKNRAFKALKNDNSLVQQFIHIDGKAYLKDDEYKNDLAAGFVNDDGDIIPRCGLILTSYLDEIEKLSKQRLHQSDDINILLISFSQEFHEYQRVKLGIDIYSKKHQSFYIDPLLFHWDIDKELVKYSHKNLEKNWEESTI